MADDSPGGPLRLKSAGVGTIGGGITLGVLSVFLPYTVAAAATIAVGVVVWIRTRREGSTGVWLGCVAVGAIGLLEAFGFGIGIEPLLLAALAVAAGLIDVFVGGLLDRFRTDG